MYCSNCGKEWKENDVFCGGCGKARETENVESVQYIATGPQPLLNEKKGLPIWLVILIIIGGIILLGIIGLILLGLVSFNFLNETNDIIIEQTSSYVYLEGDEVPSIYELFGEYKLCDTPNYDYYDETEILTYYYCDDYFDGALMNEYLDELIEEYGFEEYEENSLSRSVRKYSNKRGYFFVVKIYIYGEYIEYYQEEERIYTEDNSI